jgi:cold shock CspA family protein
VTLKEGYGFIRCTDREARMFFHYSEMLDCERELKLQQEVEFTVIQVMNASDNNSFQYC